MTDTDPLVEHEAALVAFGRYMVAPERADPETTDMAEVGRLAALVINGIPAVRAAIRAEAPAPSMPPAAEGLDVERLALAMYAFPENPRKVAAEYARLAPAVAPVGDGLREAAEAYIEAVTSYLDPDNQYTESRRRHYQRTEDALTAALAATEDPDHAG